MNASDDSPRMVKSRYSDVKSKLFVPTAAQINGKWAKEKKEPEKKWDTTLFHNSEVLEVLTPLPECPFTKKFESVQSKLLAPTVASVQSGVHRDESPVRKVPSDVVVHVSETLLKPTACIEHSNWKKTTPPKCEKSFVAGSVSPLTVRHPYSASSSKLCDLSVQVRTYTVKPPVLFNYSDLPSKLFEPTVSIVNSKFVPKEVCCFNKI